VSVPYLLLIYEKQIKNGRQQLNYSERVARLKLPVLEEQLLQLKEGAERFTRLLGEEKFKFDSERDKLIKLSGIIESELKKIREFIIHLIQRLQFVFQCQFPIYS